MDIQRGIMSMCRSEIKAIIFDFGNVICTFDNHIFTNKIAKYSKYSPEELYKLIYKKLNLTRLYETGLIGSNEFYQKIIELCELDISQNEFIEAYTNIFTPIESTFDLIKKLKIKYKLAMISNTSEWDFVYAIKPIEIFDLFDVVTLSFEVLAMKPEPRIFNDCITKLDLKPNQCIYIDDIKEYSDIAQEFGLIGIHYTSHQELERTLKSYSVEF